MKTKSKIILMDKLVKHKYYIRENGWDMPEIRNWKN